MSSAPAPPSRKSLPTSPRRVSLPVPPMTVSLPILAERKSSPPSPVSRSLPALPKSSFLTLLPSRASLKRVPIKFSTPVKVSSTPALVARPVARSARTLAAESCQLAASTASPPLKWSRPTPLIMMSESAPPKSTSSPPSFEVGEKHVVAGASLDDVRPAAAADRVVAAVPDQAIILAVAENQVGERGSVDDVGQIRAVEGSHNQSPSLVSQPGAIPAWWSIPSLSWPAPK